MPMNSRAACAMPAVLVLLGAAAWLAIPGSTYAQSASQGSPRSGPLPAQRLRADMPPDAMEIATAREVAIGAPIVLRGRVPIGSDAFARGRAIFTLVDEEAAKTCCSPASAQTQGKAPVDASADTPGKAPREKPCPAPPQSRATIMLLDGQGQPLAIELRDQHGLTPGAEVFVVGSVATPAEPGGLSIHAQTIHVPEASLPVGTFVVTEPAGALDVAEVRKRAAKGDTVVLVGRVGGSVQPFVPGRAIFTLVGRGLKACSDIPGDACTKPWDYCCETKEAILANSATIQFVAPAGGKAGPLRTEIKGRSGLGGGKTIKELSELVVVGTVAVAEKGALVVNASQVYVR